ncbi:hypothetical protein E4T48_01308 [Aureobasidium sp. EXF-10727]|nr:hypothetical protein E4T48_01308 [Aureobasidium sp. EXF-10727]
MRSTSRKACIIFTEIEYFQTYQRNKLRDTMMMRFPSTPQMFWSRTCSLHNGFFGCEYSAPPATVPYSTYFRMAVNSPKNQGLPDYNSPHGTLSYEWSDMGFLSSSSTSWNILICFNVPDGVISGLQNSLPTAVQDVQGPYALHIPLLEQLAVLYDMSNSHVQGTVASLEKELLAPASGNSRIVDLDDSPTEKRKGQLAAVFEISRHATQLVETTQIAAETIDRMQSECESFAASQKTPDRLLARRSNRLAFARSMLRGLHARAVANEKRLANEQSLVRSNVSATTTRFYGD